MICPKCQSPNAPAVRFCSNCGTSLGTVTPSGPESDQAASVWSASAAASKFDPESARGSSGNPDADTSGDEVTRVSVAGPGNQAATVKDDSATRAHSLIGRTIEGKYRLDAVIGAGGMGSVYRASRLLIGDEVAIKLLHQQQDSEAEASERFRREAQAAARLKHANAVTIYDFGITADGLQYLVMELVVGESLRSVIKGNGPLKPAMAAEILNQVCEAVDEAHRHQIVHRDLKPDNIIVNVKSTGLRVKVLDFGIAKLRDVTADDLTQTSVMGTPHYMSPEQCLAEKIDGRSDIYSLGIVLYEMLAGVVPFNSPISNAVVNQHVNYPPPLIPSNLRLPPAAAAAVMHALAKKREDRPQTARALAEEFSSALSASLPSPLPPLPQPPGPDSDSGKTIVVPFVPYPPKPTPGPGVPPRPPVNQLVWVAIPFGVLVLVILGIIAFRISPSNAVSSNGNANSPVNNNSVSNSNTNASEDNASNASPERASNSNKNSVNANDAAPVESTPPLPASFQRVYRGSIGIGTKNRQGLVLTLNRSGSRLWGSAQTSLADGVSGGIRPDGTFDVQATPMGESAPTGSFKGKVTDGTVTGYWTNGQKVRKFSCARSN